MKIELILPGIWLLAAAGLAMLLINLGQRTFKPGLNITPETLTASNNQIFWVGSLSVIFAVVMISISAFSSGFTAVFFANLLPKLVMLAGVIGMRKNKPWGRFLLVTAWLCWLPIFPYGTILGIYCLWILCFSRKSLQVFYCKAEDSQKT